MKAEKQGKVLAKEYTDAEKAKAIDTLITARVRLLLRHPFFGNMATRLRLVDGSDWCSTLATDGRTFYYNVGFVNKCDATEMEFGFAHEVLHNVFDHMGRRQSRDPQLSNIAADYAANQILVDEKIGTVPKFIKIFQDHKYRGKSYEEIYEELESKAIKIDFSKLGELLDEHLDGEGEDGEGDGDDEKDENGKSKGRPKLSEEEKKKIKDEIKEAMISAMQNTEAGRMPAGIARLVKDFTEPKMDWREMLRMNIQSIFKSNFSFNRPNRKSQHCGAILPGMMNDETIDVSVCIDMSGSISDKMAKDFLSEVKGIMEEYVDFKLDLWCFDTEVYEYKRFTGDTADEINDYECKGGGGTDPDVVVDFLQEKRLTPDAIVMLSDGYMHTNKPKWAGVKAPTLWCIIGNDNYEVPNGQKLVIR
jgi:predicted metal-dependent peptidase